MKRALVVAALAMSLAVVLPSAASHANTALESPYSCGYCLFEVPVSGGKMRILLRNPQVSSLDDISPVQQKLLFTRTGNSIFTANLNGTNERLVAFGVRGIWSPDGTQISYTHPSESPSGPTLWVVGADGTGAHPVGSGRVTAVAWAPDSLRLAYFSVVGLNNDAGRLIVATADGQGQRTLAFAESPGELRWSPRGDRLAYTALPDPVPADGHGVAAGGPREFPGTAVHVVGTDAGALGTLSGASSPAWAPDGSLAYLAFGPATWTGYESITGAHSSFRLASPAGRPQRALRRDCCYRARFLADGRLAYVAEGPSPGGGSTGQIFVARPDGSKPRQVTHLLPGGYIDLYKFSADGSKLWIVWEFTDVD